MSLLFSSALVAGTVVRVEHSGTTFVNGGTFDGTKTGSLSEISSTGDQVFVYQGVAMGGSGTDFTGRTLLYGFNITDTDWISSGTANTNISYLPTAINIQDANLDSGNFDNADYTGARAGMTTAAYRAAVANIDNFTQNNTRFDLGTGGFTINASVNLHWDANGVTAGNGGTGIWDTTTQSLFKNGASGTTFLHWVNSSAGNDHTAVFGDTAGTVSVASGGVTASGLTFDVTGYTIQNNTVSLAGTTPTINVATGASATISSELQGSSGVTKTGDGTLILTGANSYSNTTSVNQGALFINGDQSLATGAVTVSSGATLGGDGVIGGDTTISGNLRVGSNASAGTTGSLDFSSENLSFASGSTWFIDIVGAASDSVFGIDVFSIHPAATLNFSFSSPTETSYTLASYNNRANSNTFSGFADGHVFSGYRINYTNTAITLTAIPEPGTIGLLSLLLGGLFYQGIRSRRRKSVADAS